MITAPWRPPLCGAILLAACGANPPDTDADDTDVGGPLTWDPSAQGPFTVAHRHDTVTYTTIDGRSREVRVELWYPSEGGGSGEVAYFSSFPTPFPDMVEGADPAPSPWPDGLPLLVFSHGKQATGGSAQPLAHRLVSHGFVVAAPSHTPDTWPPFGADSNELHLDRPGDLTATLDFLADPDAGSPASHPLAGLVNTDRALVGSHSRGVTTSLAALGVPPNMATFDDWCADCSESARTAAAAGFGDPRLVGGVLLDGGVDAERIDGDALASVTAPLLFLTGNDRAQGILDVLDAFSGAPATHVTLDGACHETFANNHPDGGTPSCETLATDEGFDLVGDWALAFARRTLLGDTGPEVAELLDATGTSGRATVTHRAP